MLEEKVLAQFKFLNFYISEGMKGIMNISVITVYVPAGIRNRYLSN